MLESGETVFGFRSEGVIRIIRRLDAATQLARALEASLPAIAHCSSNREAEEKAIRALATWEEASR